MPKGSISIGRESLQVFFCAFRRRVVLACFTARGQSWRNMTWTGNKKALSWNCQKLSQLWQCNGGGPKPPLHRHNWLSCGKFQDNAFLFPVHAMFRHDCPLVVKPASTPRRLGHKQKFERFCTYWYAPLRRDHPGYCTAEVGNPGGTYELLCIYYTCLKTVKSVIKNSVPYTLLSNLI
jgi:hypothetical protein